MRLYIAGPMTGLPEFNYPAFFAAAERLTAAGYVTINPARVEGREHCKGWADYMRAALIDVCNADGLALLPVWEASRGACLEVHVGQALDLPIRSVATWATDPSEVTA